MTNEFYTVRGYYPNIAGFCPKRFTFDRLCPFPGAEWDGEVL